MTHTTYCRLVCAFIASVLAGGYVCDSAPGDDLLQLGCLDITKALYFADNTGREDATKAIQRAVNDARDRWMVCFFPEGTYLISDTISCEQQVAKLDRPRSTDGQTQHYWGYGLGFIMDFADLMRAVCGIDLYEHPWLRQTVHFPMYCAPPGAWAVSFADSGRPNHISRGPAETRYVRKLALRTRDPYALWYAGQREPVQGFVPKPPTDLTPSIHYRHIGWVIFNTSLVDGRQGATVAMHSGRYVGPHQHPDQNSFVIHAYGEKLAIDGGYYDWWGSPHFNAYSMNTLAHNTLLVDGNGQAVRKPGADGGITSYFDSPGYGYCVGDASNPEIYFPEWHLYATPQQPAADEEFLVAMQIQRLCEQPDPEAVIEQVEAINAYGVRFRVGDHTHLVLTRKAGANGLLRCDSLETDGQVAAGELGCDGSLLRAMAIGARKRRYNGQILLDAETPEDWARDWSH